MLKKGKNWYLEGSSWGSQGTMKEYCLNITLNLNIRRFTENKNWKMFFKKLELEWHRRRQTANSDVVLRNAR